MDTESHEDPALVDFVEGVDIAWIEVVSVSATKHSPAETSNVELKVSGGASAEENHFLGRYEATASVTDIDGDPVADVNVALLIKFTTTQQPDPTLVEKFSRSTGVLIATPYLRENLTSLAQRIGVDGVLLPLFRGTTPPPENSEPS